MNLGLRDAVTLGDALSVALREGSEDKLDEYAASSRAEAMQVVALAHRLTRLATAPPRRFDHSATSRYGSSRTYRPSATAWPSNSPGSATAEPDGENKQSAAAPNTVEKRSPFRSGRNDSG